MMIKPLAAALLASFAVAAAGCGGGGARAAVGGSGDCAYIATFQGRSYTGVSVRIAPVPGKPLGAAHLPPCDDTGGALAPGPGERVPVAELPGVPSSVALVVLSQDDLVLVRDPKRLPDEVRRLLRAPACAAGDGPLTLSGPWIGILQPGGGTEVDMAPPYDVSLRVRDASADRYVGAMLDVRVPAALGKPLTRADLRASLWNGGTITVTATCRGGRYIATQVTAAPPA
jgi:hypothetical protein